VSEHASANTRRPLELRAARRLLCRLRAVSGDNELRQIQREHRAKLARRIETIKAEALC